MPRQRPAASGYARLAQADEEDRAQGIEDSDEEDLYNEHPLSATSTRYAAIQPQPRDGMRSASTQHTPRRRPTERKRVRSNSGIDIKAINARLERWADEIASKFKISSVKGKTLEEEQLEIHHSVFQAPEGLRPATAQMLAAQSNDRMTKEQFEDVVESVRVAIEIGVHPKMISQGSSGSYFARNSDGKVVGVFKPKDEEPYASRNPKWTKWIHRNLFPCFFGRACLIPNLSYVSEAAAYVLDSRLQTNLVPYTDIVYLSSKSFFYDFWDRRSSWGRKKSLPAKVGSFQVFLKGFKDANIFLREHPWPDQGHTEFRSDLESRRKRRTLADCIPNGAQSEDERDQTTASPPATEEPANQTFYWSTALKQAFREELEKLVILDYIMRNTDRGLDNWMIKIDWHSEEVSIVAEPPRTNDKESLGVSTPPNRPVSVSPQRHSSNTSRPYKRHEAMLAESRSETPSNSHDIQPPSISLGAIDNSLSWPWKHPDAWRSFPFGWLFLPVSLIGQPFSQKTRDHFLPLLTSTVWWSDTQMALRRVFSQDSDFQESMFARQIAVMKGQAWNVVETLKQTDHGPLELTRRTRVCVWDDMVDVPVAIPMRTPSTDMSSRRRRAVEEEEMDIGAARASAPVARQPPQDLLGSPTGELPNPHRFELTRDESSADLGRISDEVSGSPIIAAVDFAAVDFAAVDFAAVDFAAVDFTADVQARAAKQTLNSSSLPARPKGHSRARFSFDFPRHTPGKSTKRQRSLSTRSGRPAFMYEGDDLEGDLGYSAASDMEGHQRKVIVERLEAVKSKNPVFTWC